MTKLDDKIRECMKHISVTKKIGYSLILILRNLFMGAFRNKMCYEFKNEVEVVCHSPIAFYTLKGHNFSSPITHNHTGGNK